MSENNSTEADLPGKPEKPSPDFPLTPHPNGRWCKKIKGKLHYFGRWDDPESALKLFRNFQAGKPAPKKKRRPGHHQHVKPYDDFPLTAHPSGRWCKKIRGRIHYFGPLADHQAALDKWLAQKDELLAGRVPREVAPEGDTLRDLVIAYLRHKKALMENGELSPRTFADNHGTCSSLIDHFGKTRLLDDFRQEDFAAYRAALAKRLGPVALGNAIQKTRSVFKFALESGILKTPILFGPGFKRPSKKTLRLERNKNGPKLFTREELQTLIEAAGIPIKAMILLAINAGLGNSDLANLPLSAVDMKTGWVDFPRPKTGIDRRFPLWPETIEAIRQAIDKRPTPKDEASAGLLFITKYGARWCKAINKPNGDDDSAKPVMYNDDSIAKEFVKLFAEKKIERKKGRGFYTIRHIFETVAGGSRDQVAVNFVMGHADETMAAAYREGIEDERLQAVVEHVRQWLFPPSVGPWARRTGQ